MMVCALVIRCIKIFIYKVKIKSFIMTRIELKSNKCDFIYEKIFNQLNILNFKSTEDIKHLIYNETRHNFISNLYFKLLKHLVSLEKYRMHIFNKSHTREGTIFYFNFFNVIVYCVARAENELF